MTRFFPGDKVTPNPNAFGVPAQTIGRVFTVEKVNPRNLRCSADDGGRGINFPAELLLPASDADASKIHVPYRPPAVYVAPGTIVTMQGGFFKHGITPTTPLIVVKDSGDKVNVVQLGGDEGRYIRVPKELIEHRTREWLTEQLVEES